VVPNGCGDGIGGSALLGWWAADSRRRFELELNTAGFGKAARPVIGL
jgi:hypothetical protein